MLVLTREADRWYRFKKHEKRQNKKIFVFGCFDMLHGWLIAFFRGGVKETLRRGEYETERL